MKTRAKTKRRTARVFTSPGHYRKAKGGVYKIDGTPVQMPVYIPPDIEGDLEIDPPSDINGYVPEPEPLFDDETDFGMMPSFEWKYDGEIDDEPDTAAAGAGEDGEDDIEMAVEAPDDGEASDEMDDYVPEPEEDSAGSEESEETAADGPPELDPASEDDSPETGPSVNDEPDPAKEDTEAVPAEGPSREKPVEETAIPVIARPVIRDDPPLPPSTTKVRWK